jgi:hypothetical protein
LLTQLFVSDYATKIKKLKKELNQKISGGRER